MISMEVDFEVFNKNFKNSGSQFDQTRKTRVTLKIKKNISVSILENLHSPWKIMKREEER